MQHKIKKADSDESILCLAKMLRCRTGLCAKGSHETATGVVGGYVVKVVT